MNVTIITGNGIDENSFKRVKVITILIPEEKIQDLKVQGKIDNEIIEIQEEIKKIIKGNK